MEKILQRLTPVGIFLLRGAGWSAVGILVGFIFSYFIRFPGRVDTFALTETLLGIVITGLSIVAAFIVAFQWSNLDSKMNAFDNESKKLQSSYAQLVELSTKAVNKQQETMQETMEMINKQEDMLTKEREQFREDITTTFGMLTKLTVATSDAAQLIHDAKKKSD